MPCSLAREPPLQAPRLRLPLCLRGLLGAGFPSRSRLSFPVCSPAERPRLPEPVSQHPAACPLVAVGSAGWSWSFTRHSALRLSPSSRRLRWAAEVPGQEQEGHLVWKDRPELWSGPACWGPSPWSGRWAGGEGRPGAGVAASPLPSAALDAECRQPVGTAGSGPALSYPGLQRFISNSGKLCPVGFLIRIHVLNWRIY